MKKFLFLAAALPLMGCGSETLREVKADTARDLGKEIVYTKDERTGLCFALSSSITYGGSYPISISNVPCSEEVLALVK